MFDQLCSTMAVNTAVATLLITVVTDVSIGAVDRVSCLLTGRHMGERFSNVVSVRFAVGDALVDAWCDVFRQYVLDMINYAMCICATIAKRIDAGSPQFVFRPRDYFCNRADSGSIKVNVGIPRLQVENRRYSSMFQGKHNLHNRRQSACALAVTHVALDRSNEQGIIIRSELGKDTTHGSCFDWIANIRACSVTFEITCVLKGETASVAISLANDSFLTFRAWPRDTTCSAVGVYSGSPDHCSDWRLVGYG